MRLTRGRVLVIILVLLVLGALAMWRVLHTEAFWRWSGRQLVTLVQEQVNGDLTVRDIQGTPLTGLAFLDVRLATPQGEVFFAPRLELRLSLWSLIRLQPVVARLSLVKPRLTLRREAGGAWEAAGLLKDTGKPGALPAFREITLSQVVVEDGELVMTGAGEVRRYPQMSLDGALNLLHPFTPQQTLQLRRGSVTAPTPWGRLALSGRLAFTQGLLNLLSLTAALDDKPLLSLAGEVNLGEDLSPLRLTGEVGPAPADLIRRFWPRWPEPWEPGGKFNIEGTSARLLVEAAGRLDKEAAFDLKGSLGFSASGLTYDLHLNAAGLHVSRLAPAVGYAGELPQPAPAVGFRLKAAGAGLPWAPERLDWSVKVEPCTFGAARVESLELALTGSAREQRFAGLAQGNFGKIQVNAFGPLHQAQGELALKTEALQPALLSLKHLAGTNLTGSYKGTFRLPSWRQPERLRLAGEAEVRGRLLEYDLKELAGRFTWEKPRLEVAKARLVSPDLTVDFGGSLEGERLAFTYQAQTQPGGGPLWPASWRGRLTAEGKLTGTLATPEYSAQGKAAGLAGEGWALDSAAFKAAGAGWPPQGGSLELQGSGWKTPVGNFAQVRFQGQGEGRRWRFNLQSSAPGGPQAELAGTADLAASPHSLVLERCRVRLPQITLENRGPVPVRFAPGLEVGPASFQAGAGRVNVSLKSLGADLSGQVTLQDLPAGLFSLKGQSLAGKLNGNFTFSGEARQPLVDGSLTLTQGRWGNFSFQQLRTTLNLRGQRLQFAGSLEEKAAGPRLTWEGYLPLHLSFAPFRLAAGTDDFQVRLKGDRASLSLLAALSPEIESAQGSLDLEALWQGKMTQPRLTGQVRWGAGTLQLRQTGLAYRLEPGTLTLEGDRLTFSRLVLVSGGSMVVTGTLTLAGFQPKQLDVKARLENFKAMARVGAEGTVTGNLTFSGPWSRPVLAGHLTVPKGSLHGGIFTGEIHEDIILVRRASAPHTGRKDPQPPRPPDWTDNVRVDVTVDTPGIWVKDTKLLVLLAGQIKAAKLPGQPLAVAGDLRAVKGAIELHGRSFKVAEGNLHLPGKPGVLPTLKGRAVHEVGEVTLVMLLSGPVSRPEVRLESIPPLPPQDLLSYLVFGRPARALTREEYLRVGPKAAGIVGGLTAQKLQEFLGKDFPLVGNVTLKAGADTVGVAKPLTKDLTISYERKTETGYREDVNQMRLEYRVNRYLSIESQLGRRNSGADVLFNLDW